MPVIVVGADAAFGREIASALVGDGADVRAFVSDPDAAEDLKAEGVKVALGDLSDHSHLGAAATNTFCAVLLGDALGDGRELAFGRSTSEIVERWAEALAGAAIQRVIWVGPGPVPEPLGRSSHDVSHVATSGADPAGVAAAVLAHESAPRRRGGERESTR